MSGFPESTILACIEFHRTGSSTAFDEAFGGLILHHLPTAPAMPVSKLPGSTQLVADLGLDSLTLVEMVFLFEDLFEAKLPHEEYIKITTLEELRTLLRSRVKLAPPV